MRTFLVNPNIIIEKFNKVAASAQRKAFITVDIDLQKAEIEALKIYRIELIGQKKKYIKQNLENEANLIYCIENSLLAIEYELQMLINIKEGKMSDAWENLINAQTIYGVVVRNCSFEIIAANEYIERLEGYEKLLFPKMHFASIGGIIKKSHCSICNENYNKCVHVKGKVYNGELCVRVVSELELEEISYVDTPASKHCRAISTEYEGKTVDILTLKEAKTLDKT